MAMNELFDRWSQMQREELARINPDFMYCDMKVTCEVKPRTTYFVRTVHSRIFSTRGSDSSYPAWQLVAYYRACGKVQTARVLLGERTSLGENKIRNAKIQLEAELIFQHHFYWMALSTHS
jgi:hypothetical protein